MAFFKFLNPARKGKKFAFELKTGKRYTNDAKPKRDSKGNHLTLTKEQAAYRGGYLDARKDNARAYKANKAKRAKARAASRAKKKT